MTTVRGLGLFMSATAAGSRETKNKSVSQSNQQSGSKTPLRYKNENGRDGRWLDTFEDLTL
jgi:hypothetical protein